MGNRKKAEKVDLLLILPQMVSKFMLTGYAQAHPHREGKRVCIILWIMWIRTEKQQKY